MTDAEREFRRWLKREKRKGLKGFSVSFKDDKPMSEVLKDPETREEFYIEMNAINRAVAEGRSETLTFHDAPRYDISEHLPQQESQCDPEAEEIISKHLFED
jgi:hypothetical protein